MSATDGGGFQGQVYIGGNLLGLLEVVGNELAGPGMVASSGLIQITGGMPDDSQLQVEGDVQGTLNSGTLAGDIHVGGDLYGTIVVTNSVEPSGLIEIAGDMWYLSLLQVGGHFRGQANMSALEGAIHIGGDMSGLIDVLYCIGDPGHIRVNGGFRPYPGGPAPRIEAFDMGSPRSYITFDYDCSGDPWALGAQVVFHADPCPYTHNTPSARVWHCVHCFADMNNDGSINSADGTPLGTGPFFLALNDPPQYALNFAGLGEANPDWNPNDPQAVPRFLNGPVLFHGNCNCDALFNWDDEPDFLHLVSTHACVNGCIGRDALERVTPDELATEIVATVDPAILPDAPALMQETIALYEGEPEPQAYWQAVKDNITP